MPRFSNRPFLATTFSLLSSRADDLACGEVMKSMNKTRPKSGVDSIWFNILYIGSEASGSAVRHSCAPLLPAHKLHKSSPNPHRNTNLPFVIPGFQEWSAEPQIPRLPRISCKSSGFGQLLVVLFRENHISGRW
jgi:hypothetical protein